jgi:hypothetical protein
LTTSKLRKIKEKQLVTDNRRDLENNITQAPAPPGSHARGFSTLDLPEKIMDGIRDAGFVEMTPVQSRSLPMALEGKDVCAPVPEKLLPSSSPSSQGSSEPDPCQNKRPP